jgi:hypothetical protein
MVAVTADPSLVAAVADQLLHCSHEHTDDPVVAALDQGRKHALRLITQESYEEHP